MSPVEFAWGWLVFLATAFASLFAVVLLPSWLSVLIQKRSWVEAALVAALLAAGAGGIGLTLLLGWTLITQALLVWDGQ